ncbi:MAG TPA: hypothetical protein VM055_03875 [Novosphingobium sp.]|nr:hypothetical protein [Novosphingobium sp.]
MLRRAALAKGGVATALLVLAAPAAALPSFDVPEPSDPSLFALGVVGLLVGRYVAGRKPRP